MPRMTASKTSPPKFTEPWHADVFAMTLELSDNDVITWVEWTATFGAQLRKAADAGGPIDGSDYYDVWLEALEFLLVSKQLVLPGELTTMRDAWATAYLNTPHGKAVRLETEAQAYA